LAPLDPTVAAALKPLEYDRERYFLLEARTLTLPVSLLVASRARPDGIANANAKMREAYNGRRPRRRPITVRALANGRWLVIDGNSTFVNALHSGWRDLPCNPE
jgi:hypothetical protein